MKRKDSVEHIKGWKNNFLKVRGGRASQEEAKKKEKSSAAFSIFAVINFTEHIFTWIFSVFAMINFAHYFFTWICCGPTFNNASTFFNTFLRSESKRWIYNVYIFICVFFWGTSTALFQSDTFKRQIVRRLAGYLQGAGWHFPDSLCPSFADAWMSWEA